MKMAIEGHWKLWPFRTMSYGNASQGFPGGFTGSSGRFELSATGMHPRALPEASPASNYQSRECILGLFRKLRQFRTTSHGNASRRSSGSFASFEQGLPCRTVEFCSLLSLLGCDTFVEVGERQRRGQ